MISDAVFYSSDGKKIERLGHIKECELASESEIEEEHINRFYSCREWEATIEVNSKSVENIEKYIIYGGDRGRYNGHVLHRDGYLSPQNAWLGNQ